ncbi:hypothetical protein E2C01_034757 [Portunus trituberculatus]|uniref:Uncharacterized protein n=1 Tax=Portunus trituberculatus TaxID=210409 RepID=A0A5B7F3N8_PORTR|nr:hypothetical protein [Portunus trituberculatus]
MVHARRPPSQDSHSNTDSRSSTLSSLVKLSEARQNFPDKGSSCLTLTYASAHTCCAETNRYITLFSAQLRGSPPTALPSKMCRSLDATRDHLHKLPYPIPRHTSPRLASLPSAVTNELSSFKPNPDSTPKPSHRHLCVSVRMSEFPAPSPPAARRPLTAAVSGRNKPVGKFDS